MPGLRERWTRPAGYREVLSLSVPMILAASAWTIQHFVDRIFLAWHSPEAIAASTPAGLLNYALMCVFIGTAAYVGTFVAQYHGAGQPERIGRVLWQGLYISALGGLVMALGWPLAGPLFRLVGHGPTIEPLEIDYFRILCLGAFPAIAGSALGGFYTGRGRPWPVLWINIFATVLNCVMNYILIFGHWGAPRMGVSGAAVGTVVSAFGAFFAYYFLIMRAGHDATHHTRRDWRPDWELLRRILRYGLPSGIEIFLDLAGFALFVLLIGRLGTTSLAATNIALNVNMLAFLPMLGTGTAVSVLVGQHIGAGRPDLARRGTFAGFHLTFLYMLLVASAYFFAPGLFIAPFAVQADPALYGEIFAVTAVLLKFVAVYSLFDAGSIIFCSAVKGAGDTRFVMFMLGTMSLFILVGPTLITVVVFQAGLYWCWLWATSYAVLLGLAFYWRFAGGKWETMRVIEAGPPVV